MNFNLKNKIFHLTQRDYQLYLNIFLDNIWSSIQDAYLKSNNYKSFTGVMTIDSCKDKCLSELGVRCGSLDYRPDIHECHISKVRSDSSDYKDQCPASEDCKYTERIVEAGKCSIYIIHNL